MKFTPNKINLFALTKLPSAYFTGVRVKTITNYKSEVTVNHKWLNQNPFRSIFWAVQGMAAELSSGVLVMKHISDSGERISMLVTNMNASFSKKATGRITFTCDQGEMIEAEVKKAIETKQGRTFLVISKGVNQDGVEVSKFQFEWSIKVKG